MASCRYYSGLMRQGATSTTPEADLTRPRSNSGGLHLHHHNSRCDPLTPHTRPQVPPPVGQPPKLYNTSHSSPGGGGGRVGGEILQLSPRSDYPLEDSVYESGEKSVYIEGCRGGVLACDMTQLMGLPRHQHGHLYPGGAAAAAAAAAHTAREATAATPSSLPTGGGTTTSIAPHDQAQHRSSYHHHPTSRKVKRSASKSTYKHIPHREKAPHLVARRNARERRRVQAVNTAFVRLRRHVPHENRHKRLSKVKTLHFAIDYINYMQRLIHEYDAAVRHGGPGQHGLLHGAPPPSVGLDHGGLTGGQAVDMVELNSTKENRWMPMNLSPGHLHDQGRDLYLPDSYNQFHQG